LPRQNMFWRGQFLKVVPKVSVLGLETNTLKLKSEFQISTSVNT